jgi:uncharacterized membrane protein YphA (DoxX/SURF4 family)
MQKANILFWVFTGLLSVAFILASIDDVMVSTQAKEIFKQLQYPEYLIRFVGIAKLLGVAVILMPGFPRLKEWAYAGLVFDVTGALYGCLATGVKLLNCSPMLIFYALIAGSYIYYHKKLKLQASRKEALRPVV